MEACTKGPNLGTLLALTLANFGKHAGHRCEVADIAVDDAEQRDDRGLVGGDGIEIAHARLLFTAKLRGGFC